MSRSAVAAGAPRERRLHRPPAPAAARRISGPAYDSRGRDPRPRLLPSPHPAGGLAGGARALAGGGAAIVSRAAALALDVSASRAMDRLVRSRGWIVIVGFGLMGIVAMQVSLLKLNSGIGRAVEASATLERSNATLRLDVSQLSATDRILRLATHRGFVMPAPVDVHYLRAGNLASDARRAVDNMRAPGAGTGLQTLGTASPAAAQTDNAILASGLAAPNPSTIATAGAHQGPASPGGATAGAQPNAAGRSPVAGGAVSGSSSPASPSGGVTAPTTSPTTTGP